MPSGRLISLSPMEIYGDPDHNLSSILCFISVLISGSCISLIVDTGN